MTTISAKMICHSVSEQGIQLPTFQLRYPKFIHGEFMTHRVFSRNASSSRAVPVIRLIQDILDDPAVPMSWGKNQPGMQAREECDTPVLFGGDSITREHAWLLARDRAVAMARAFAEAGYHKQIINRLLEPFCHINVVVTATEWTNFFALRDHPDAMPEIQELARAMKKAMAESTPTLLQSGEWHVPYVTDVERINLRLEARQELYIKLSVARCARVSYLTQDGKKPSIEEDLALYERLASQVPLHASPCEHQATPDHPYTGGEFGLKWQRPDLHGNLRGWIQYRKTLPGERQ